MKFKVGDRVKMKRDAKKIFNSWYTTGTVRKVEESSISVKRDFYLGHENTWWDGDDWRKIKKLC